MPINELKGKSKEQVTEVIKGHIVEHLTANITKYNTDVDGSVDMEGLERDLQNVDSEITQQIANDIADVAVSAEAAAALTEATAAIATVDVNDAAAVAAAEADFEAAFEAAQRKNVPVARGLQTVARATGGIGAAVQTRPDVQQCIVPGAVSYPLPNRFSCSFPGSSMNTSSTSHPAIGIITISCHQPEWLLS